MDGPQSIMGISCQKALLGVVVDALHMNALTETKIQYQEPRQTLTVLYCIMLKPAVNLMAYPALPITTTRNCPALCAPSEFTLCI